MTVQYGGSGERAMSKLGFDIPDDLEKLLHQYVPWGSKGTIITELLWQLIDKAKKDKGRSVYDVIAAARKRSGASN